MPYFLVKDVLIRIFGFVLGLLDRVCSFGKIHRGLVILW